MQASARREAKRYHRIEGVDLGETRGMAMHAKIGGVWHWVPLSVIADSKKVIGALEQDEIIVEEWYARRMFWL